jgi:mRNA-degrading endonuclease toxin of MazEF toxin-antitoxin module
LYERPVLIIKIFNEKMLRVVPLTSIKRQDENHIPVSFSGNSVSAKLSQLRTISTQRLSRKLGIIDQFQFNKVVEAIKKQLI